jgi:hypothetical protein
MAIFNIFEGVMFFLNCVLNMSRSAKRGIGREATKSWLMEKHQGTSPGVFLGL